MSGTSLDGVDGVLVDLSTAHPSGLHHAYQPFPQSLARELLDLNRSGPDELHRAALAANALSRLYARVVEDLLSASGHARSDIKAIGAHGQTVRHRPLEFDATGYTWQLNNPALLAELTGIDVVADFRNRDLAAGGQGAPLVPAFHQAMFGRPDETVAVLNVGGISNISVLGAEVIGFDCGPGNALMDGWCLQHRGEPFDAAGAWAASGQVHAPLLAALLGEDYFALPPPKSTGRDLFNAAWLDTRLQRFAHVSPVDVQATLAELTAVSCAHSVQQHAGSARSLVVCGGGALNTHLMARLQANLPSLAVLSTLSHGLAPLQVEATAFAWLARKALLRETGSLKSVTGARGARILGSIYPA